MDQRSSQTQRATSLKLILLLHQKRHGRFPAFANKRAPTADRTKEIVLFVEPNGRRRKPQSGDLVSNHATSAVAIINRQVAGALDSRLSVRQEKQSVMW